MRGQLYSIHLNPTIRIFHCELYTLVQWHELTNQKYYTYFDLERLTDYKNWFLKSQLLELVLETTQTVVNSEVNSKFGISSFFHASHYNIVFRRKFLSLVYTICLETSKFQLLFQCLVDLRSKPACSSKSTKYSCLFYKSPKNQLIFILSPISEPYLWPSIASKGKNLDLTICLKTVLMIDRLTHESAPGKDVLTTHYIVIQCVFLYHLCTIFGHLSPNSKSTYNKFI